LAEQAVAVITGGSGVPIEPKGQPDPRQKLDGPNYLFWKIDQLDNST